MSRKAQTPDIQVPTWILAVLGWFHNVKTTSVSLKSRVLNRLSAMKEWILDEWGWQITRRREGLVTRWKENRLRRQAYNRSFTQAKADDEPPYEEDDSKVKPASKVKVKDKGKSPKSEDDLERIQRSLEEEDAHEHRASIAKVMIGAVLFVLVVLVLFFGLRSCGTKPTSSVPVSGSSSATATPVAYSHGTTWKLAYSDYGNNRWFADGLPEIQNASNPTEAANAAFVWLERVKPDPNLLIPTIKSILGKDVQQADLFKDGWATPEAAQLVAAMQLALGQAKVTPDEAPANGTNSGVDNGVVVSSATPGIHGNRKAIKIVLSNGQVFWVMARCGNVVTLGPPRFPPGRTDNAKDPSLDPAARGNAPIGGGHNDTNGPGTYIPPGGMIQPPATARVNPPTPAAPVAPPVGSTPDPAPAPPKEGPITADPPVSGKVLPPGTK